MAGGHPRGGPVSRQRAREPDRAHLTCGRGCCHPYGKPPGSPRGLCPPHTHNGWLRSAHVATARGPGPVPPNECRAARDQRTHPPVSPVPAGTRRRRGRNGPSPGRAARSRRHPRTPRKAAQQRDRRGRRSRPGTRVAGTRGPSTRLLAATVPARPRLGRRRDRAHRASEPGGNAARMRGRTICGTPRR